MAIYGESTTTPGTPGPLIVSSSPAAVASGRVEPLPAQSKNLAPGHYWIGAGVPATPSNTWWSSVVAARRPSTWERHALPEHAGELPHQRDHVDHRVHVQLLHRRAGLLSAPARGGAKTGERTLGPSHRGALRSSFSKRGDPHESRSHATSGAAATDRAKLARSGHRPGGHDLCSRGVRSHLRVHSARGRRLRARRAAQLVQRGGRNGQPDPHAAGRSPVERLGARRPAAVRRRHDARGGVSSRSGCRSKLYLTLQAIVDPLRNDGGIRPGV